MVYPTVPVLRDKMTTLETFRFGVANAIARCWLIAKCFPDEYRFHRLFSKYLQYPDWPPIYRKNYFQKQG